MGIHKLEEMKPRDEQGTAGMVEKLLDSTEQVFLLTAIGAV